VPTSLSPVDVALIVNGLIILNNPPDIDCAVPPFIEKVAVIVNVSPSSSMKYAARGIDFYYPCTIERLGGELLILGAVLVTFTVNVFGTETSRKSETVNVIV
jgi:hypothetical protein